MYKNLLAEMARNGLTRKQLAQKINMKPETLYKKLQGRTEFTLPELSAIKEALNPSLNIEYLFEK